MQAASTMNQSDIRGLSFPDRANRDILRREPCVLQSRIQRPRRLAHRVLAYRSVSCLHRFVSSLFSITKPCHPVRTPDSKPKEPRAQIERKIAWAKAEIWGTGGEISAFGVPHDFSRWLDTPHPPTHDGPNPDQTCRSRTDEKQKKRIHHAALSLFLSSYSRNTDQINPTSSRATAVVALQGSLPPRTRCQ